MDNKNDLKKKVVSGLFWRFAERSGAQIVSLIVTVILARILSPNEYGTIALITVFTTILQVFIDGGFGNALIQKKDADDVDFSTVFIFNLCMCGSLYIIMFMGAPFIAQFYKDEGLIPIIRVLSFTLVISGLKNVQQAYVSRHMLFKRFFFSTLGGTIVAAITGIFMAYKGAGVWALVAQQLINNFIDMCILWFTVGWRPSLKFSLSRLKTLYNFGWKSVVSNLLNQLYTQLWQLSIGKRYSAGSLAYYNQGEKFPKIIITNINSAIDSVLLPTMSNAQEDKERVKSYTRRAIVTSTYLIAPIMMGLFAIAEPLVKILLTDKWLPCVPYFRIFCVCYMFYPIHTANLNAITALGRTDYNLKLEIMKKIVGVATLFATINYGPLVMASGLLFTSFAGQIINSWPNRKLLNYSYLEQMKDILPNILLACGMGIIVGFVNFKAFPVVTVLIVKIIVGILVYLLGSVVFKIESLGYVLSLFKRDK